MVLKKEQIIIRVSPGLKKRIESTAKKQGKNVSDFIRDIITLFLDRNKQEYFVLLHELDHLKNEQETLNAKIHEIYSSGKEDKDLSWKLAVVNQKIYDIHERIISYENDLDNE